MIHAHDGNHGCHVSNCDGSVRHDGGSLADSLLLRLRDGAAPLRALDFSCTRARIPLERVEIELARVVRLEMASELARAHALITRANELPARASAPSTPRRVPSPRTRETAVGALQREIAETIAVARSIGVRVPRVVRKLVAGGPSTWPAQALLARWAEHLGAPVAATAVASAIADDRALGHEAR